MKLYTKYVYVFFILFTVLYRPYIAGAATTLTITEIMYDASGTDSGHEWVEVYNGGSAAITIQGGSTSGSYRFNDGASHYIAEAAATGSMTIAPSSYAVFADDAAKFLADYPGYNGTLIDTTISLSNTGGTVKILDGDANTITTATYAASSGAAGDGNSLQLSGTKWTAAVPTPGVANVSSVVQPSNQSSTSSTASTSSTQQTSSPVALPKAKQMSASIVLPPSIIAGVQVVIEPRIMEVWDAPRTWGYVHISFGDGTEVSQDGPKKVTHTYAYPGTYVVMLEYNAIRYGGDIPDLSARTQITVMSPGIQITAVNSDGSIELQNTSSQEVVMSGWTLTPLAPSARFVLPKNTLLLPGGTLKLGTMITKFMPRDTARVVLALPSGEPVSTFSAVPSAITSAATATTEPHAVFAYAQSLVPVDTAETSVTSPTEQLQPLASVVVPKPEGMTANAAQTASTIPAYFLVGLLGVLGIAFIALWYFNIFSSKKVRVGEEDEEGAGPSDTKRIADSISIVEE